MIFKQLFKKFKPSAQPISFPSVPLEPSAPEPLEPLEPEYDPENDYSSLYTVISDYYMFLYN